MTLYDLLETLRMSEDYDELTKVLINLDTCLEYLHNHGHCIYDFNPKKIILENGKLTLNSFESVINDIGVYPNSKEINIFQNCKIGLTSYNNMPIDANMNQDHYNFIRENLNKFNNNVPEEIFEYYEEVFLNSNLDYLKNYLVKKRQEAVSNQNTNVRRKTLATDIGRSFVSDDNAYVKVLFLPTLITFTYLLSLFLYCFVFK